MTPAAIRVLADLRHQLLDPPTLLRPSNTDPLDQPATVGAVASPSGNPDRRQLHRTWDATNLLRLLRTGTDPVRFAVRRGMPAPT